MMKEIGSLIYEAVRSNRLSQPFNVRMVKSACPHAEHESSYSTFLPKHAEDNPGGYSALFVRVSRGLIA
jgi:hypothetical protein